MITNSSRAVGPQIRMLLPTLTPREQSVVQYMLNRGSEIHRVTIADVAEANNVSDAMIVKLAKKLGYNGYRELRAALTEYNQLAVSEMYEDLSPTDTPEMIIDKVFKTAIQALQETQAILDINGFNRAVDAVYRSRQRDFYGVGGSAIIAQDAAHKFLRIGIRAAAYDDPHLMMMSAALLTADDVVLAVSHSGRTSAVIEPARLAKQNGATVIALVNYSTSPLAQEADIVLCSTARGSPLMGENAAARVAQLNILDALFVCIAQQDYARAEQSLDKTMTSVRQKRES